MANLPHAKLIAAFGAALVAWSGLLGSSTAMVADRVVAVVNDDLITTSEVTAALGAMDRVDILNNVVPSLKDNPKGSLSFRDQLEQLITERLLVQEAKTQGITATDEEARALLARINGPRGAQPGGVPDDPAVIRHFQDFVKIAKLIGREVDSKILIGEDEVERYYHEHSNQFALPARVHVRQIFFSVPANAPPERVAAQRAATEQALADLQGGADFATLARERSEGAEAKNGGDLGYFGPGELLPAIDQALSALPIGGMSGVVQSPIGFHIVKVEDKQTGRVRRFDEVKTQVQEQVYQERSAALYRKWIRQLRARAYVEIK